MPLACASWLVKRRSRLDRLALDAIHSPVVPGPDGHQARDLTVV